MADLPAPLAPELAEYGTGKRGTVLHGALLRQNRDSFVRNTMDRIASIHSHVAAGDLDGAMTVAQHLLTNGQAQDALDAFYCIREAFPQERASCTAQMADAYAVLGDDERAREHYLSAGALGAPAEWVSARLQWLHARHGDVSEVYIGRASRDPGAWNQRGLLVLRATHLVFLPSERPTHIAAIAAKAFTAMGGLLVLQRGGSLPVEQLDGYLRGIHPQELDSATFDFASQLGGVVYRPGEAFYRVERLLLGTRVSFSNQRDRILALKPAQQNPLFQRLAASWPTWS